MCRWALIRSGPSKIGNYRHSYRGALPDYPLGFEGVWSQVLVAQGRRTGWELLILEEGTRPQALLLQGFIVLLQILDGIPVGSKPVRGRSLLAQPRRSPGHACPPSRNATRLCLCLLGKRRRIRAGRKFRWSQGCPKGSNSPGGRRHHKCKYVPKMHPREGAGSWWGPQPVGLGLWALPLPTPTLFAFLLPLFKIHF